MFITCKVVKIYNIYVKFISLQIKTGISAISGPHEPKYQYILTNSSIFTHTLSVELFCVSQILKYNWRYIQANTAYI